MSAPRRIVIIGAGLAGAAAAGRLREEGYAGSLVLVGDEREPPYERPPLSKGLLRGEEDRAAARVHDDAFYADAGIELRAGEAAVAIDPASRSVSLSGGGRLAYDRLLLATGAEPRRLPVPGADLEGVLRLRTLDDAERLRAAIGGGGRLVVVGAGWIGCEVAASARRMGAEVAIVEREDVPLATVLGAAMGRVVAGLHRDHGVDLRTGTGVAAIEGAGRAERVRLHDGDVIDCSAVLVGVGAAPRTGLAEAAGLAVQDGVLVDSRLRTSAPGVFAAGDVAGAEHPFYGRRVRVEHWANARHQGRAAARNMLGADEPYDRLPYFFSDQYDLGLEYSGLASGSDEVVVRGDVDGRELIAFWIAGGVVAAAMNLNVWEVVDDLQRLIRARVPADRAALRDPGVPLASLVHGGAGRPRRRRVPS